MLESHSQDLPLLLPLTNRLTLDKFWLPRFYFLSCK